MRVRHKANIQISDDAAAKDKLFALDDALAEEVLDGFTEQTSGTAKLLVTGGAYAIPFGPLSDARGLYLKTTGELSVSINGAATFNLKKGRTSPTSAGAKNDNAKMLIEAALSSVTVTPLEDAVVTYALWGDPLP